MDRDTPVVGWRVWRLDGEKLRSWVVDWTWEPGRNHARCLDPRGGAIFPAAGRVPCPISPGEGCWCGFWALWDLASCVSKARREGSATRSFPVIGLVSGWGTVAVHGSEGFRAQYSSIMCLFSDSVWAEALDPLCGRPLRLTRWVRRLGLMASTPRPPRALERASAIHQVPLLSLSDAVRTGVLGEFGVPSEQVHKIWERLAT